MSWKSCLWPLLFCFLAVGNDSVGLGQTPPAQEGELQLPRSPIHSRPPDFSHDTVEDSPLVVPLDDLDEQLPAPMTSPRKSIGEIMDEVVEQAFSAESRLDIFFEQDKPYNTYRAQQTGFHWIAASNNDFGLFSWHSDPYLHRDSQSGLSLAFNLHWLSGPSTPDVSPRLYDAIASYQVRRPFSASFSYDVAASVGVFSDFSGSARQGVRFPAHAVGMVHVNHRSDLVFGVDYLDRDDLKILPVLGISIREFLVPNVRLDLVFPRPRLDIALDMHHRIYLAGLLGGGTWDFKSAADTRELLTYRDYRVVLGFEYADTFQHLSAVEFGYAFSRQLTFAEAGTTLPFPDSLVLQWVSRY